MVKIIKPISDLANRKDKFLEAVARSENTPSPVIETATPAAAPTSADAVAAKSSISKTPQAPPDNSGKPVEQNAVTSTPQSVAPAVESQPLMMSKELSEPPEIISPPVAAPASVTAVSNGDSSAISTRPIMQVTVEEQIDDSISDGSSDDENRSERQNLKIKQEIVTHLPKTFYVIVSLHGVLLLLSLLESSGAGRLLSAGVLVNLILCAGLFMNIPKARKILLAGAGVVAGLAIVGFFFTTFVQHRNNQAINDHKVAINSYSRIQLNSSQQAQLKRLQEQTKSLEAQAGMRVVFSYILYAAALVEAGIVVLLLRSKAVKTALESPTIQFVASAAPDKPGVQGQIKT